MTDYGGLLSKPVFFTAAVLALAAFSGQAGAQTATDLDCSGCVETKDLADDSVGQNKLKDNAVGQKKLKDFSVGQRKLKPEAVATVNIRDAAVTAAKLADDAVFGRILVVRADPEDRIGNCDELRDVLGSITDNDTDNRYLIHLEPGIYYCTDRVRMRRFVAIQGSGEQTTVIRGRPIDGGPVVAGADSSELRFLRVEHTGSCCVVNIAVQTGPGDFKLTNVTVVARDAEPMPFPVPGPIPVGAKAIGVNGPAVLVNVTVMARPSNGRAIGINVTDGAATFANVTARTIGGLSPSPGLSVQTGAGSKAITVRNSVLIGKPAVSVGGGTLGLISTQLAGGKTGSGEIYCVAGYDEDLLPLDQECNSLP